jgi:hypothetical protein
MANGLKNGKSKLLPEKSWKRVNELFLGIITLITITLICLIGIQFSTSTDAAMTKNSIIAVGLMSFVLVFLAIIYSSIQYFIRNALKQQLPD